MQSKLNPKTPAFIPKSNIPATVIQQGSDTVLEDLTDVAANKTFIEKEMRSQISHLLEEEITIEAFIKAYCNPAHNRHDLFCVLFKELTDEMVCMHDLSLKKARIYCELFLRLINMNNSLMTKQDLIRMCDKLTTTDTNYEEFKYTNNRELFNEIYIATHHYLKKLENLCNMTSLRTLKLPTTFTIMESPPKEVTEKVYFILNNICEDNVQDKSNQLADVVTQDYMAWFAQYIVMKRVTTETNFHELFIQLIDNMADPLPVLMDNVLMETYRNIKVLLMNMKSDLSDFNDRQILKNLGKFLGMITLSKNKPILHDDINLRHLIYEAYAKGHIELHYVVPFVIKTLEAVTDSIIFKPPCPWTMAILKVLKELHGIKSVKLNLKFEVEILCRRMNVNFKELKEVRFLRDRKVQFDALIYKQSNRDGTSKESLTVAIEDSPGSDFDECVTLASRARAIHLGLDQMLSLIPVTISVKQDKKPVPNVLQSPTDNFDAQEKPEQFQLEKLGAMPKNWPIITTSTLNGATPIESNHFYRHIDIPYEDLNTQTLSSFISLDNIPVYYSSLYPNLKSKLIKSMEKIIHEVGALLYDSYSDQTITTVTQLAQNDFDKEMDIEYISSQASSMLRFLMSSLCLTKVQEVIHYDFLQSVIQTILHEYPDAAKDDLEILEKLVHEIIFSNIDLCIIFLQKILSERSTVELAEKLEKLTFQDKRKYETLRDLDVYDNFKRMIPGFQSMQSRKEEQMIKYNSLSSEKMMRMFYDVETYVQHIEELSHIKTIVEQLRHIIDTSFYAFQEMDTSLIDNLMNDLVNSFMGMFHMQLFNDEATNANMKAMSKIKDIHMYLICSLQPFDDATGHVSICTSITNVWLNMDESKTLHHNIPVKFNAEAFAELLKIRVISLLAVDNYLSKKILENNVPALMFTLDLLKFFVTGDKREFTVLNEFDLSASIDSMNKLMTSSNSQMKLSQEVIQMLIFHLGKLNQLLELGLLEKTQSCNFLYNGISLSRKFDDPPAMFEGIKAIIRMWIDHYCSSEQRNPSNIMTIITTMIQGQIVHDDESFVRFIKLATFYIVDRFYNNLQQDSKYYGGKNMTYMEIDAYAMMVSCIINNSPLTKNEMAGKVCLLNKSLGIIAGILLKKHEIHLESFHPLPFQRIFIALFNELQTVIDEEQQHEYQDHVLTAFVHTFHVIRPKCAPAFVFSWLELISHRNVVSKILKNTNLEYTHSLYVQLLCDLYIFLKPFLQNLRMPNTVQSLYKGTTNLTCLLMHDFPEILINYHSLLCTILPSSCIQLRNIVLGTTTKEIPHMSDVLDNIFLNAEHNQVEDPTGYCMSAGDRIKPHNLRIELDSYLASRAPVKFLSELVNGIGNDNVNSTPNLTIYQPSNDSLVSRTCYIFKSNGIIHYDIDLMNNIIIYISITAIKVLREKNIPLNINTIAHTAQMDIIQSLVLNLDNEGRFLLLNCMVNQLRFPNSHTYYFIFTILFLFSEQPQESVKEQIVRVILERIIVNRPHPWGLLFVMKELFKNKSYKFWEHKFLHCSSDIKQILQSVGQAFGSPVPPQVDEVSSAEKTS